LKEIRCLKCGSLILSDDFVEKLCRKIVSKNDFSLAEFVTDCPRCHSQIGVVLASDSIALMILYVPPDKTKQCLRELKQMLEEGLSIATIASIINESRKPEYVNFL